MYKTANKSPTTVTQINCRSGIFGTVPILKGLFEVYSDHCPRGDVKSVTCWEIDIPYSLSRNRSSAEF